MLDPRSMHPNHVLRRAFYVFLGMGAGILFANRFHPDPVVAYAGAASEFLGAFCYFLVAGKEDF